MKLREMFVKGMVRAFPHVQRRLELANAYQNTFNSPAGQMVLRDIMRTAGVLSVAYVEGDPHGTHFNDGKRAIALHIIDRMRWSEGELASLAQEATFETLAQLEQDAA